MEPGTWPLGGRGFLAQTEACSSFTLIITVSTLKPSRLILELRVSSIPQIPPVLMSTAQYKALRSPIEVIRGVHFFFKNDPDSARESTLHPLEHRLWECRRHTGLTVSPNKVWCRFGQPPPPSPTDLPKRPIPYHREKKKKPTTPRPTSGSVDPRRCSCDASGVVWETCRRETMEVGGPGVGVLLGGPSVCRGRSEAKWTDPKSYVRSMCGRSPAIL